MSARVVYILVAWRRRRHVVVGIVFAMIWRFNIASSRPWSKLTPQQTARLVPPAPHLQVDPFADLAQVRAREERLLHSYGWTSADHSTARIPIDRAMALVVGKSLDCVALMHALPAQLPAATLAAGRIGDGRRDRPDLRGLVRRADPAGRAGVRVHGLLRGEVPRRPQRGPDAPGGTQPYRGDELDDRPVPDHAGLLLLGRQRLPAGDEPAAERHADHRDRPALDVEVPASHRAMGDQQPARAGWPGRCGSTSNRRMWCTPCTSPRCASRRRRFPAAPPRCGSRRTGSAPTGCSVRSCAARITR